MAEGKGKAPEFEKEKGSEPLKRAFDFIFLGTGEFAAKVLSRLLELGAFPSLVITSPDRPKGRGLKLLPTEVKRVALASKLPCLTESKPNEKTFIEEVLKKAGRPDFILVSDYGYILGEKWLSLPEVAPLNIHPSLLPRYRGAAPIERCLMNCEKETGLTIMVMDEGVDTGPLVLQEKVRIRRNETGGELRERLATIGAELAIRAMEGLLRGEIEPRPQEGEPSYAPKIKKEELWIDWEGRAKDIACKINALSPSPGARTYFDSLYVKLLRASFVRETSGEPGEIIIARNRLFVAAAGGGVEILELQPASGRPLRASAFVQGRRPARARSGP